MNIIIQLINIIQSALKITYLINERSSSSECSAQEQVLHCKRRNQGCSSAEGGSSTANSGTQAAVLSGMNMCYSFPLPTAPHSLFNIWTDLRGSKNIPVAPAWRWGEWVCLTEPSGLHRNSSKGLKSVPSGYLAKIRDSEIPIPLAPKRDIGLCKEIASFKKMQWITIVIHGSSGVAKYGASTELITILGLDVCPLSVLCPVLYLAVALTFCSSQIQGEPPLCMCLMFWSIVCAPLIGIWPIRVVNSWGCKSYI